MAPRLEEVKAEIARVAADGGGPDYAASRGEYLNGLILAEFLDAQFFDAADLIFSMRAAGWTRIKLTLRSARSSWA